MDLRPRPIEPMDLTIPKDLLDHFEKEIRIVVRFPWIIGIPVPIYLLKQFEVLSNIEDYEVMLVPKQLGR